MTLPSPRTGREVIAHLERYQPEFIILQCGADSLAGDPITHLQLVGGQPCAGRHATWPDSPIASGHGRLLALGGGGYNRGNLAAAWNAVVEALLQS